MRIQLLRAKDPDTELSPGDTGTIVREHTEPTGTILDVLWDNGQVLPLTWGRDAWKVLELSVPDRPDNVVWD